ncbi:capsular polysaccharide biosynthesis protein [Ideonella livida]|uniref:Capsular polysaccharide biosynthesis protein n=1 Tax=Ideonella livida TaxID=2707176 RepID=A0A7C9TLC8_9BURK|nr:capsular polysaccharide biosynthesis protein [Ideonella livida]NDY91945.1 capsular polysaccharide biosynthesis protein [Ideonella livida]
MDDLSPDLALAPWRHVVAHGQGVRDIGGLSTLLQGYTLLRPGRTRQAQAVLAWGRKPSAERAERWGRAHGLPLLRLEDAFLRSVGLGDESPPLGLVLDDRGIYYDAGQPSRLDALLDLPLEPADLERGQHLLERWCALRLSKYNQAREHPRWARAGDVLVVDQTAGDASIAFGQAEAASFQRMLEAALDEHPGQRVLLKVHPDVLAGRKSGHFDPQRLRWPDRVHLLARPCHPPSLLQKVAAVYVVTSQMGFEALLWGRPVRCFGMPFYAGRGLTADDRPAPDWRRPVPLPALALAALARYARYRHPETGQRCEVEALMDWMGWQRQQRERFAPRLVALGFSGWKRPLVRQFLAGSQVRFQSPEVPAPAGAHLVLWGLQPLPDWTQERPPASVLRLEDGFLRSVGLGADLVRPVSWVADHHGLHYDARQPSDLERLLQTHPFPPELLARAARLRERILALRLTKYNVGQGRWRRPPQARQVVLVVGQVESDAALRHAAPEVCTNMGLLQAVRAARPQAWVVYKPHPDVLAGLRRQGQGEDAATRWCDECLADVPMPDVLDQVDEVHVLTSLAGFEALMRGRAVVTWGQPFYAGWGLTEDRCPVGRRRRQLPLDALVAATLLLYPTYLQRDSGQFCQAERTLEDLADWARHAGGQPTPLWRRVWRRVLRWGVERRRSRLG